MLRTFVFLALLVSAVPPAGCRSADETKAERILARDDRELTDIVCAWLAKDGAAQSPAEHALADATKAFEMVGDEGLSAFVDSAPRAPSAERARDALNELGLTEHARVFTELLAASSDKGKGPIANDTVIALEDRFRALPDPAPSIAKYVRAHAREIRLARANEQVVPAR